ncbi:hypothetical Protein YC6258_01146 [Gynuella sunshinyii YC6258]|uniref:Uncharacterized protein n=2 Tax=Gynuella sunshinyii TaxID=1445505 RepID=A0A0C5VSE4_9GAMM|nr:hypothetical Protein YC6258_01146 [Gynuella sunshinyii YC6258]
MHPTLQQWLDELEQERTEELKLGHVQDLVLFSFTPNNLSDWGMESLSAFLQACAALYGRLPSGVDRWFYAWLDEMAGQFRICATDRLDQPLPFGCQVNPVSLETLIQGIFAVDSGLYSRQALDVWQVRI